ncbi:hypothetical protein [Streptomyces sp. 7N604]|uniref:hypothetical protein n=1 Tax=Streptomyces sp. 7N604 TaxID=3457415 RepID=UPI003FCF941E
MAEPGLFLLIETQGHWSGPHAGRFLDDAVALAGTDTSVTVFLAQDGVFAAVPGAVPALPRLAELGGRIWVDDFSVAQRALTVGELSEHVTAVGMDAVARALLADGCKVVWH